MRRAVSLAATFIFLVLAPGIVAGYIPWRMSGWRFHPPFWGWTGFRYAGAALIAAGLPVLLESFVRFAWKGLGTPAPVMPTRHLVVSGLYRHVRNPMYVAVVAMIAGQALLFSQLNLLLYAAGFWIAAHLFVIFYEEPTLHHKYGAEYDAYREKVPGSGVIDGR